MLEGLVIGVVSGVISGLCSALLVLRWWRPRFEAWQFVRTSFVPDRQIAGHADPIGQLYKLRFALTGRNSPEWGAVEITWRPPSTADETEPQARQVFAKWDETPMPLEGHDPDKFRPELVPSTYYQPLVAGRVYEVPLIFEDKKTGRLDVFSGWWFGRLTGYKSFSFDISPETTLGINLVGSGGLNEHLHDLPVSRVLGEAEEASDARESLGQERVMEKLRNPTRTTGFLRRRRLRRLQRRLALPISASSAGLPPDAEADDRLAGPASP